MPDSWLGFVFWLCLLLVVVPAVPTIINRGLKLAVLKLAGGHRGAIEAASGQGPRLGVAFHVAICNEDPQVVLATLGSLAAIDYPTFEVMVVDNNTREERLWRPIQAFCEADRRFRFWHVDHLEGYKAGALTFLLARTPGEVDVISVVDADALVRPDFLRSTIPHFADPKVAIVQTPLGFLADPQGHSFMRWIELIYRYFLGLYMPAADRFDVAPFIGCMGLLRRAALEEVGGWNGHYLTEDMELSSRLFAAGYFSRFLDVPFGRTLPPADFRNFKRQHRRWNHGNTQILRERMVPTLRSPNPGGLRYQIYLACPGIYLNVYLLPFALVTVVLTLVAAVGCRIPHARVCGWVIDGVIAFELIGEAAMFVAIARRDRVSALACLRGFIAWWALAPTAAISSVRALTGREQSFEITAKGKYQVSASWTGARITEMVLVAPLLAATVVAAASSATGRADGVPTEALLLLVCICAAAFVLPTRGRFE